MWRWMVRTALLVAATGCVLFATEQLAAADTADTATDTTADTAAAEPVSPSAETDTADASPEPASDETAPEPDVAATETSDPSREASSDPDPAPTSAPSDVADEPDAEAVANPSDTAADTVEETAIADDTAPTGDSFHPDGATETILSPDPPQNLGFFGADVDVHVDTIIVTEQGADVAHVYERSAPGANSWLLVKTLTGVGLNYGDSTAVFGDTAVVGAPDFSGSGSGGLVAVYERDLGGPDNWGEAAVVFPGDPQATNLFGEVALWEDTLAVGAGGTDTRTGAVYVFGRDVGGAGNWGQITRLQPADVVQDDNFGTFLALYEDTLVATSAGNAAYVFQRNAGGPDVWGQVAKLAVPSPLGVGIWGDTIIAGSEDAQNRGTAYVFDRNAGGPGVWGLVTTLRPSDSAPGDRFAGAVDLYGTTALLGDSFGANAAYVYERFLGTWVQVARYSSDAPGSVFGSSVALWDGTLVIADSDASVDGTADAGVVHVIQSGPAPTPPPPPGPTPPEPPPTPEPVRPASASQAPTLPFTGAGVGSLLFLAGLALVGGSVLAGSTRAGRARARA